MSAPHPGAFVKSFLHSDQLLRSWYMAAFQPPLVPEFLIDRFPSLFDDMLRLDGMDGVVKDAAIFPKFDAQIAACDHRGVGDFEDLFDPLHPRRLFELHEQRRLAADAHRGRFSYGDAPTLADVYLIPQIESARRFGVDLTRWPRIAAVDAACQQWPAFRDAAPAVHAPTA